jgi:hypothetical protein
MKTSEGERGVITVTIGLFVVGCMLAWLAYKFLISFICILYTI